jgi:hypothetical protein
VSMANAAIRSGFSSHTGLMAAGFLIQRKPGSTVIGTGSVSCNLAFVLHLCHFLNQEELMEREAMVQNP